MTKVVKSPYPKTRPTDRELRRSGRQLAAHAAKWMEGNRDAFLAVYRFLKAQQARGSAGRVRDWVICYLIQEGYQTDARMAMINGDWAVVARYYVLLDPSLFGAPIRLVSSVVDHYGLVQVSWLPDLSMPAEEVSAAWRAMCGR